MRFLDIGSGKGSREELAVILSRQIKAEQETEQIMERNIHAYDENKEWQLPDPGALTSAKA